MGVLNATPDSFSDGGRHLDPAAARRRVDELLAEGADVIDIGGESTRPGAASVPAATQVERVRAPLEYAVRERRAIVSIDTQSPEVARFALASGAQMVNDVSCLADDGLARAAAEHGAMLLLMHARGPMASMRGFSDVPGDAYGDVVLDVVREWRLARDRAVAAGLPAESIVMDPGLGFMKNAAHSVELLARLGEIVRAAGTVAVGPSRKSFISKIAPSEPGDRLGGTIAACLAAVDRGALMLRVHDVAAVRQALLVHRAIGGGA
jgi:dihydropteroate synthase